MFAHNLSASLVLPATFTVPGIARSHLIPKSLQMVTAAMKLKDTYSLEGKL